MSLPCSSRPTAFLCVAVSSCFPTESHETPEATERGGTDPPPGHRVSGSPESAVGTCDDINAWRPIGEKAHRSSSFWNRQIDSQQMHSNIPLRLQQLHIGHCHNSALSHSTDESSKSCPRTRLLRRSLAALVFPPMAIAVILSLINRES